MTRSVWPPILQFIWEISILSDFDPIDDFTWPLFASSQQRRLHPFQERQSKSVEEREEEYQRARERIFNKEVREREQGGQNRHSGTGTERIFTNFSAILLQPFCTPESAHAETR